MSSHGSQHRRVIIKDTRIIIKELVVGWFKFQQDQLLQLQSAAATTYAYSTTRVGHLSHESHDDRQHVGTHVQGPHRHVLARGEAALHAVHNGRCNKESEEYIIYTHIITR